MAYDVTPRWNGNSNGSVLEATKWLPGIEADIPLFSFWPQFLGKTWGNVEFMKDGAAKLFKVSYMSDETPTTTPLTAGEPIAVRQSTKLTQATGTLQPYGDAEVVDNFTDFVSDSDLMIASGVAQARGAFLSRNALVGAVFTATTNCFTIDNATTVTKRVADGTVELSGVSPILPYHIKRIVSSMRRMGVPTFSNGLYVCIGAPGAFDYVKDDSTVVTAASNLGLSDLHLLGEVRTYNGALLVEESGPNAVSVYDGTESRSTIFGANAVVGYDTFERDDLIQYYKDANEDFGRAGKIGWSAVAGYVRPVDAATNGRVWNIYHGV